MCPNQVPLIHLDEALSFAGIDRQVWGSLVEKFHYVGEWPNQPVGHSPFFSKTDLMGLVFLRSLLPPFGPQLGGQLAAAIRREVSWSDEEFDRLWITFRFDDSYSFIVHKKDPRNDEGLPGIAVILIFVDRARALTEEFIEARPGSRASTSLEG